MDPRLEVRRTRIQGMIGLIILKLQRFQRSGDGGKYAGGQPQILHPQLQNAWNGNSGPSLSSPPPPVPSLSSPPPNTAWSPVGGPPPFLPRGHPQSHSLPPPFDFSVPPPGSSAVPPYVPSSMSQIPASGPIIQREDAIPPQKATFGEEQAMKGPGCNRSNLTVLSGGRDSPQTKYPRHNSGGGNFVPQATTQWS